MALPRTRFSSTALPEFGTKDAIPPFRFPCPAGFVTIDPVGNAKTGYNPNWRRVDHTGAGRLANGSRAFICRDGEYLMITTLVDGLKVREVCLCRDGALELIGAVENGYNDIDDLVSQHFDPEVARLRRCQREDNVGDIRLNQVYLTDPKGPLRDTPVGGRFVTSWGRQGQVLDHGKRSTRFELCPDVVAGARQLTSEETRAICTPRRRSVTSRCL